MKHLLFFFFLCIQGINLNAQQAILDEEFGDNGISITAEDNEYIYVRKIIVPQDNKVLILTASNDGLGYSPGINIRRINTNGMLDSSFGTNGVVRVYTRIENKQRYGGQMCLQKDGKLIVLTYYSDTHFGYFDDTVWLQRFLPDGRMDSSFGINGAVSIQQNGSGVSAAALQVKTDDRIVFVVSVDNVSTLRQYLPGGTVDNSFGENGIVYSKSAYDKNIQNLMVLPGNKMIAAGSYYIGNGNYSGCLVKYNQNGKIDSSAGVNGVVTTNNIFPSYTGRTAMGLQLQHDGKLLFYTNDNGSNALLRYKANGAMDETFGNNGKVITAGSLGSASSRCIDIQGNDKIIVALYTGTEVGRYNTDGSIDSSFGVNGILSVPNILGENVFVIHKNRLAVAGGLGYYGGVQVAVYKACFTCSSFAQSNNLDSKINEKISILKAYPNPVRDILYIQTNSKAIFTLTDQSGKILLIKTINGNGAINVSALPAGLYYLRNNETGEAQKIMIAK